MNAIYAEYCYTGCHYAKCHYAVCHFAECRGGISDNLSTLALLFLLQQVKGGHLITNQQTKTLCGGFLNENSY